MRYDVDNIKAAARGRWGEILAALGGIDPAILDGRHGPCPLCGGRDRFRALDDFHESGAVLCNQCFSSHNGDGIAALQWLRGWDFLTTLREVAGHLGIEPSRNGSSGQAGGGSRGRSPHVFARPEVAARHVAQQLARQHGGARPVAGWDYGSLVVIRFDLPTPEGEKQRKEFRPVRRRRLSDGRDAWELGYPDGPRPLYRLADLENATDRRLLTVHAGEKACDAARQLGLLATTNAGGEQAIDKTDWEPATRFEQVVVVVDNDEAGGRFGQRLTAKLKGIRPDLVVKIIRLPGLPPKGDIYEWAEAGGTACDFLRLVEQTAAVTSEQAAEWQSRQGPASSGELNHVTNAVIEGKGEDKRTVPLSMDEVIGIIRRLTEDWPRRVENALFVDDADQGVCWLERPPSLFGWLGRRRGVIDWHRTKGCVSKEEVYAELQRTATAYDALELLPHEPPLGRHYYACRFPEPGDGRTVERFLDFFCLESDLDRQLSLGIMATPLWSGPSGARPAGMFTAPTGRGKGKTKLATSISRVYGGHIDVSSGEEIGVIKTRLLTAEAAPLRIALLDNVKSTRFSWAELEALITAPTISGKRLYVGNATRPNYLTWLITLNGASLSTDLAQRVVEIRLAEPTYDGGWAEEVSAFIEQNRARILGDLIAFLRRPPRTLRRQSRWSAWESGVLARLPDPDACLDLILERRGQADVEAEESEVIEDYFASKLRWLDYDPDRDDVFLPNEIAAQWFNQATGDHKKVTGVTRTLKQLRDEGRVWHLVPTRAGPSGERGFRWVGEHATAGDVTHYDVRHRISQKKRATDEQPGIAGSESSRSGDY